MSETVILCEGYYDRAFWDGLLKHLGCTSLKSSNGQAVYDRFNNQVKGGDYAYNSATGRFIRVRPCNSKDKIRPAAKLRLRERTSKALGRLVINVDADTNADGTRSGSTTMNRQAVEDLVREFDPTMTSTPQNALLIDGGATEICLVRREASDPPAPGLPNQQTLERLVCGSICAAYPERAQNIQDWLDARHEPPPLGVKEYAFSHMAGWYPEHGCDAFYGFLWNDAAVAAQLEARLRSSGAWQIIQNIAA